MVPEPDRLLIFDRKDAAVLLALLVLAVIILWPMLAADAGRVPGMSGRLAGYGDARTQWYPWRAYAAHWMKQGVLPSWNPYILCGTPFVGSFQSAVFYPPNLIFLAMPVHAAARVSIIFHVALSLVFTYLLARSFGCVRSGATVAAMAFSFGAAQLLRVPAGHWGVSCAIPWMPLIFLCVEARLRRPGCLSVVVGAIAVAMQVLSGVPQYAFITGLAVGVFVLLRSVRDGLSWKERLRRWGALAGLFLLGAAIAAIQLLPGIEAALHGARSLPMRKEWIEQFSLAPESLLTLFVPGFFGGVQGVPWWGRYLFWEMIAYVGIVCLALALLGMFSTKRRGLGSRLGVFAVIMLLLALGRHAPLMPMLTAILPMSGMFRGAAKFLLPFQLALAVLAGLGVTSLLAGVEGDRRRGVILSAGLLVVMALLLLVAVAGETLPGLRNVVLKSGECLNPAVQSLSLSTLRGPVVSGGLVAVVLLAVLAAGQFFLAGSRKPRSKPLLAALLCLLVAADMACFGRSFVRKDTNSRTTGHSWPPGAAGFMRAQGGQWRVLVSGNPNMNDGMLARVPTLDGIEPNPPARFHQLFREAQGLPTDVAPSLYQVSIGTEEAQQRAITLARLTALGRALVMEHVDAAQSKVKVIWPGREASIVEIPTVLPRAFVVYDAYYADSREEALRAALQTDTKRRVILNGVEQGRRVSRGGPPPDATPARIIEDGPNRVVVEANARRDGWLVLADNFYPGWKATLDAEPVRILPANFAFRAVAIPRGTHTVCFSYAPASLKWGAVISFAAIIACAVLVVAAHLRDRRRRGAEPEKGIFSC